MNRTSAAVHAELVHRIFDASNVQVAETTTPDSIPAGGEASFEFHTDRLADYRTCSPSQRLASRW